MGMKLIKSNTGNYDYYEFISNNGIHYELLEGVTFGGNRSATSGMCFIMLNTFNIDERIEDKLITLMGGCSAKIVNFFCSSVIMEGNDAREADESIIRHYVSQFEADHHELISFIKENNIPTSVK